MASLTEYSQDIDTAKPLDSFEPIPAGTYEAVMIDSEAVPTKKAGGERIKMTWQIISGEHEGRKVFDSANTRNENPKAVEIGMRQLKSIALAVGHTGPLTDSADLHDKPCLI